MPRLPGWVLSMALLAVDQGTKTWILSFLEPGESWPLLGNLLRITRVHNPGAAFGLFPQGTAAFLATSAVVSFGLLLHLLFAHPRGLQAWGSALILGGAVGNLIDRARLGYVVDLFSVENLPVFNVADVALVVGVGFLALGVLRRRR